MSENVLEKSQNALQPSPIPPAGAEGAENDRTGRVSIDRYLEALRKGVILSQ